MKLVCIRNRDDDGSVPWTKEGYYHKLKVGKIYDGEVIEKTWGGKSHTVVYLKEFNFNFQTPWWFITLEEWREKQLNKIL